MSIPGTATCKLSDLRSENQYLQELIKKLRNTLNERDSERAEVVEANAKRELRFRNLINNLSERLRRYEPEYSDSVAEMMIDNIEIGMNIKNENINGENDTFKLTSSPPERANIDQIQAEIKKKLEVLSTISSSEQKAAMLEVSNRIKKLSTSSEAIYGIEKSKEELAAQQAALRALKEQNQNLPFGLRDQEIIRNRLQLAEKDVENFKTTVQRLKSENVVLTKNLATTTKENAVLRERIELLESDYTQLMSLREKEKKGVQLLDPTVKAVKGIATQQKPLGDSETVAQTLPKNIHARCQTEITQLKKKLNQTIALYNNLFAMVQEISSGVASCLIDAKIMNPPSSIPKQRETVMALSENQRLAFCGALSRKSTVIASMIRLMEAYAATTSPSTMQTLSGTKFGTLTQDVQVDLLKELGLSSASTGGKSGQKMSTQMIMTAPKIDALQYNEEEVQRLCKKATE